MRKEFRNAGEDSRSRRIALHERHALRIKALKRGYDPNKRYTHDGVDTIIAFLGFLVGGLVLYSVLNVIF